MSRTLESPPIVWSACGGTGTADARHSSSLGSPGAPGAPGRHHLDAQVGALYRELRELAERSLRRERPGHTLQATAIVNEVYLRLVAQHGVDWTNRAQFFAVAATTIRRLLVDHARARRAVRRGGGAERVTFHEPAAGNGAAPVDLLLLDDALRRLADIDGFQARIVEMRYFGGATIDQVAGALGVSHRSVDRAWVCAKAWLFRELA